jgi:hypothetical protein
MKTIVYPWLSVVVLLLLIIVEACGTVRPRPKPLPIGLTDPITAKLAGEILSQQQTHSYWLGLAAKYLDNAEHEPPLTPAQRAAYFLAGDLEAAYPKRGANWLQLGTYLIAELQRERARR